MIGLAREVPEHHNSSLDHRHRGLKGSFTELNYSSHQMLKASFQTDYTYCKGLSVITGIATLLGFHSLFHAIASQVIALCKKL